MQDPIEAHVRVAVLVYGVHGGVEHVRSTTVRNFIFSQEEPVLRYDNLLTYSDINPDRFDCDRPQPNSPPSPFLVGPKRDTLKVQLIILPQRPYKRRERWNTLSAYGLTTKESGPKRSSTKLWMKFMPCVSPSCCFNSNLMTLLWKSKSHF